MGVTAGGLPYPEPTDAVAAGADAIKALAQKTELRYQAGNSLVSSTATGGLLPVITFGAPFAAAPSVVMTLFFGSGGTDYTAYLQAVTATGFTARLFQGGVVAGAGVSVRVYWVAIGLPT